MSQQKRREKSNKLTRWDRIRKRQLNSNPLSVIKTDAVRRFIELDYVDKRQSKLLIEGEPQKHLNPSVIMDMRHEMFAQIPRKLPLATVAHSNTLESTKAHNLEVEQRYMHHQLQKFRQQLVRQHPRQHKLQVRPTKPDFKLNHGPLMESLAQASRNIDEFYKTPVDALQLAQELCSTHKQLANTTLLNQLEPEPEADVEVTWLVEQVEVTKMQETFEREQLECGMELDTLEYRKFSKQVQLDESRAQLLQRCRTPSPLLTTEELLRPMRAAAERQMLHLRTVRHEEELQLQQQQAEQKDQGETPQLQRESSSCSNTSDGIDSVISDLAEEALYELQLEAAEQQQQQLDEALNEVLVVEPPAKHVQFQLPTKQTSTPSPLELPLEPLLIRRIELPRVVLQPKSPVVAEPEEVQLSSCSEDDPPHEKQRIIEQLFQARDNSELNVLRKYFLKWIHYTTMEKLERESGGQKQGNRAQKINAFLDKIRREKRRQRAAPNEGDKIAQKSLEQREEAVKMAKQFKNKLKVQQDIIDLQRIKLERQERLIMQLKLNKLSDEAKEAREDLKQELKTVIRCGDPKAKAKAKCLQLIGSLRDAEDDELERLQGKALLQPRFLQHMQERALERSVRHEQARQRRAQAEAEREAAKLAVEEAKRQQDEEAKLLRIEVLKEKRRQEKMAKVLKERERQRFIENQRKALEFSRRLLLRRVGMEAFKRLLQRKRENQVKSEEFCRRLYKRNYFHLWRSYTEFRQRERRIRADLCYQRALKRRALHAWLLQVHEERKKLQVAIDWHALHAMEHWFNRWLNHTTQCRLLEDTKMRQAISHHEWHLKWKVLDCWQRLPQILRLERETEERRQRWRMKIWELLPDYKPREDSLW
ncbi:trichohyalin [Drosophila sulfurigaster albostrigata]|uniref:trichohyalin n=1 Tax=Drosophila sulfurigaster albostrigata TaxID=89887 RepID=UPI002D21CE71|nr:trichohyalin [Drosophila sulfurigaster albostrigata]